MTQSIRSPLYFRYLPTGEQINSDARPEFYSGSLEKISAIRAHVTKCIPAVCHNACEARLAKQFKNQDNLEAFERLKTDRATFTSRLVASGVFCKDDDRLGNPLCSHVHDGVRPDPYRSVIDRMAKQQLVVAEDWEGIFMDLEMQISGAANVIAGRRWNNPVSEEESSFLQQPIIDRLSGVRTVVLTILDDVIGKIELFLAEVSGMSRPDSPPEFEADGVFTLNPLHKKGS